MLILHLILFLSKNPPSTKLGLNVLFSPLMAMLSMAPLPMLHGIAFFLLQTLLQFFPPGFAFTPGGHLISHSLPYITSHATPIFAFYGWKAKLTKHPHPFLSLMHTLALLLSPTMLSQLSHLLFFPLFLSCLLVTLTGTMKCGLYHPSVLPPTFNLSLIFLPYTLSLSLTPIILQPVITPFQVGVALPSISLSFLNLLPSPS